MAALECTFVDTFKKPDFSVWAEKKNFGVIHAFRNTYCSNCITGTEIMKAYIFKI